MADGTLITSTNFNSRLTTLYNQTIGTFIVNVNGFPSQFSGQYVSTKPAASAACPSIASAGSPITITKIENTVATFLAHLARLRRWVAYNYYVGAYGTTISQLGYKSAEGNLVLANINTASSGAVLDAVANGGYNTCIINGQIYQKHYSQQDTRWDTKNDGSPCDTEKIMLSGLDAYFNEIKAQYNKYIAHYTVICISASCHNNCHSSCHSNRGRR